MSWSSTRPRVAMLTYSTKPRGGVVHALELSEALHARGEQVHLFGLGDPAGGFYRPTSVPYTLCPPLPPAETLEGRVYQAADALAEGLATVVDDFDVFHAQDCIAARAALAVKAEHPDMIVVRTVHHVDDFTTPALVECQKRSIIDPDHVIAVSRYWMDVLERDFSVRASIMFNGVNAAKFALSDPARAARLRSSIGADGRFLFLTVGGIEPRKGSMQLMEALAVLKEELDRPPLLAIVGGHSFQDHSAYRESVFARVKELGLQEGQDFVVLGTVPDKELPSWYRAADAFVFPSLKEGWGLAVLEAMAAGLPTVVSDIPVFREYLTHDDGALLVDLEEPRSLAETLLRIVRDPELRARLTASAPAVAARFTWDESARSHAALYRRILEGRKTPPVGEAQELTG